ncbi:MAG: hypothetical protein WC343_10995, partial [Bacilli bacterium]
VSKFEASSNVPAATSGGGNDTALYVKSLPNVNSWRGINIGNAFTVSRNMEKNTIYGWGTSGKGIDTHMMKNSEWGAVAYLTQSTYGKNSEVFKNNSTTHITGCASSSSDTYNPYEGCQYTYNTTNGWNASTSGTIHGIYDMSGGREWVAAYINNANQELGLNGSPIINASDKYKDIYTIESSENEISNYALTINKKGDAVYETSISYPINSYEEDQIAWFDDQAAIPYNSEPWFDRGGTCYDITGTGIFNFFKSFGDSNSAVGFRAVIVVNGGL